MHDDEEFNAFLRREVKNFQADAPPPAEAIWSHIERDVQAAIRPSRFVMHRSWMVAGVGIAATLVIGVAVGRWSSTPTPAGRILASVAPAASTDSSRNAAYEKAATIEHLAEAEVFLTTVRADLKADRRDVDRAERSRELLARTRLLLGSDAKQSPAVERLLGDLELLLAEIAATPESHNSMDTKILDETMRHGNVIPRIRATLPAPTRSL